MKKIGYTRSAQGKPTDMAIKALKQYGCETVFQDTGSRNADKKYPQLEKAVASANRGDMLVIHQFTDLATSASRVFGLILDLSADGISFASIEENLDTTNSTGAFLPKLAGQLISAEKRLAVERAQVSMEALKASGNTGGRPPVEKTVLEKAQELIQTQKMSVRAAAAETGTSQATLYRFLKEQQQKMPSPSGD